MSRRRHVKIPRTDPARWLRALRSSAYGGSKVAKALLAEIEGHFNALHKQRYNCQQATIRRLTGNVAKLKNQLADAIVAGIKDEGARIDAFAVRGDRYGEAVTFHGGKAHATAFALNDFTKKLETAE